MIWNKSRTSRDLIAKERERERVKLLLLQPTKNQEIHFPLNPYESIKQTVQVIA